MSKNNPSVVQLREALEASWQPDTAFEQVAEDGNPALGQCYPTSRVVQHFFPTAEIVKGDVWTGNSTERHFWNVIEIDGKSVDIDLSWQQFPQGSVVKWRKIILREELGDSDATIARVETLLTRVKSHLKR